MSRYTPATVVAVVFALVAAACGSDTNPPSPNAVRSAASQASIAPTAVPIATATPAPAASPSQTAVGPGGWVATGSMVHGRYYGATATTLEDGRVLVVGGEADTGNATASAELYDPVTGRWATARKMHAQRRGHVATLLADGRVLVAGGWSLNDGTPPIFGELYDPSTGSWTKTSPMTRWRYSPSATLLADGRVLVAGGYTSIGGFTRRAEIYDPTADVWTATRNMAAIPGPATSLADGRVLVLHEGHAPEVFDPASGRWRAIASPLGTSPWDTPVRLSDGEVLLLSPRTGSAELYDPGANAWNATSGPHTGAGPAVVLADGTVLVVGQVSSARFDPVTGSWSDVPRPPLPRDYALDSIDGVEVNLIAVLGDGRVLATEFGSAAVYDPMSGS